MPLPILPPMQGSGGSFANSGLNLPDLAEKLANSIVNSKRRLPTFQDLQPMFPDMPSMYDPQMKAYADAVSNAVPMPNRYDEQLSQLAGEGARAKALQDYFNNNPLPQFNPSLVSGGTAPSHEFATIPNRINVEPHPAVSALAGIMGLISPQFAGQFNSAPLEGAMQAGEQLTGDALRRYQMQQAQNDQSYGDKMAQYQADQQAQYANANAQNRAGAFNTENAIARQGQMAPLAGQQALVNAQTAPVSAMRSQAYQSEADQQNANIAGTALKRRDDYIHSVIQAMHPLMRSLLEDSQASDANKIRILQIAGNLSSDQAQRAFELLKQQKALEAQAVEGNLDRQNRATMQAQLLNSREGIAEDNRKSKENVSEANRRARIAIAMMGSRDKAIANTLKQKNVLLNTQRMLMSEINNPKYKGGDQQKQLDATVANLRALDETLNALQSASDTEAPSVPNTPGAASRTMLPTPSTPNPQTPSSNGVILKGFRQRN